MAKQKSWNNDYEKISELGEGGNAIVYHVKCKVDGQEFALKELATGGTEKKARFIDEINIIKNNCEEIDGIIPIIDSSTDEYWYVMPIAQSIH